MSEQYPHLADLIGSHLDSDPVYSMSQWIEEEGIPDTEFLAMARDAELGAAWAEVEAALPEGWWIDLRRQSEVSVRIEAGDGYVTSRTVRLLAAGDTPAAALRALAAKLREHAA